MPSDSSFSLATRLSRSTGRCKPSFRARLGSSPCTRRQGLVGKTHVHDARRVAFGGGEVDQAAFAQQVEACRPSFIVYSSTKSRTSRLRG